ncbi:MAG: HdeD family acid-resistance protein [Verrucomicrobiota bacterium]
MSDDPTLGSTVKAGGGFFLFLGIFVLLLGFLSIAAPFLTGIAITVMVGATLLVCGIVQLLHGFQVLGTGAKVWAILVGVLTIVVGVLVLVRPVSALAGLTLILACFFVADGILTGIAAFQARPNQGWAWLLFSAIVTFLLGAIIWRQWPVSGTWAIGILIGIRILLAGFTMIFMGSAVRVMGKELESAEEQVNLQTAEGVIDTDAEEVKEG